MVRSPDGNSNFFDIVTGVLQGDTLALFLFIIGLKNGFKQKKARSRQYPAETIITDADNITKSICFNINSDKTEFMHFKRGAAISTLNVNPMK